MVFDAQRSTLLHWSDRGSVPEQSDRDLDVN